MLDKFDDVLDFLFPVKGGVDLCGVAGILEAEMRIFFHNTYYEQS